MAAYSFHSISHQDTSAFSTIVLDYLQQAEALKELYGLYPTLENIEHQIEAKKKQSINRNALVKGLQRQYENIELHEKVAYNIKQIAQENCFTICTAHQPIIYTGPLFFIIKILHAIKLADTLQVKHPSFTFVPVFYIGSEDADIEEIGTTNVYNQHIEWRPQEGGPCGRIPTDTLAASWKEIKKYINLNSEQGQKIVSIFEAAYRKGNTLGQATIEIVNALFEDRGLVVINPDNAVWKSQIKSVIKDELLHQSSHSIVEKSNAVLNTHYKSQAFSREINLFYLQGHSRERIERNGNQYSVVNTNLSFTEEEILAEAEQYPERFSPNVILRGILQETILPNICFVGGGGELAYWLQLKKVFEHHQIVYPILVLRQSISVINAATFGLLQKTNTSLADAFLPIDDLKKKYIKENFTDAIFAPMQQSHKDLFSAYNSTIASLSSSMQKSVEAHFVKSQKIQARLQQKIIAAYKKKEEVQMKHLEQLHNSLFSGKTLKERKENFIPYFVENGQEFLDNIYEGISLFGNEYVVMVAE
jgi:bacillithiol synthase